MRVIFKAYTKCRYNYTAEKSDIKGPCIILCNHTTTLDPFFVSLSFKMPLYFFASDDIFNIRGISPIIRYLVAPIPKSKSKADMNAVRISLKVLKEGGAVAIFPEGNRTLSGRQWEMTDAVAKLVKLSKVPLVLYNIRGGYGTDPRWGLKLRKGKMRGAVVRVMQPQEYKELDTAALFDTICKELEVYDPDSGVKFKSRRRAENVERVLYMCPHCLAVSSIKSRKSGFACSACGKRWEYTEDLHISPNDKFDAVDKWHDWEKQRVAELVRGGDGRLFYDGNIKFYESVRLKRKRKLDGRAVAADRDGITVIGKKGETRFAFGETDGFTILGKRKFNVYYGGKTFQVKGDKKFCPLKYLHLYEEVNNV